MCKEINIKELSSKDYQERQQSIALFLLNNSEIKEAFWQNLVKYNIEFLTSIIKISSQMSWKSIYRLLIEIDRQLGHNMLYLVVSIILCKRLFILNYQTYFVTG